MHSRIFQITQTRVEKENYLNEDTLMQGDNSHFDYCAEIDDEERKENIEYLVNHILPKDRVTRHKSGWLYLILARAAPVSFIAMSCRTSVAGFFAFLPVPYPRSNGMTPLLLVPALQVVSTGGNTVHNYRKRRRNADRCKCRGSGRHHRGRRDRKQRRILHDGRRLFDQKHCQ